MSTSNKNMELMDSTIVNLKIISELEPAKKLETDGVLFQEVEWSLFPAWARRWWYGHGRQVTLHKIKQLYTTAFARVKADDCRSRILKELQASTKGLMNLKSTYAEDHTICSQLDVLIDDIKILSNQNAEVF